MIVFCDEDLNLISFPVESYTSFTWEESWTEPGSWSITLNPVEFNNLKNAAYIYYDVCGWGVVESIEYTRDSFKMGGRELSAILDNYVVTERGNIAGRLEYLVRALVLTYSNVGLAADNNYDNAVNAVVERGSLMTILYNLLIPRGMSFRVSIDIENHGFVFDVLRGVNRTSLTSGNKISPAIRQSSTEYVVLGQEVAASVDQRTHLHKGTYDIRIKSNVAVKLGARRKSTGATGFITTTYAKDIDIEYTLDTDDSIAFWVYRDEDEGGVLTTDLVSWEIYPKDMWAILSESKGNITDSKFTRNTRDYKNYVVINVGDADTPNILEYDFRDVL